MRARPHPSLSVLRPTPRRSRRAAGLAAVLSVAALPLGLLPGALPGAASATEPAPLVLPGGSAVLLAGRTASHTVVPARPRPALRAAGDRAAQTRSTFTVTYRGFSPVQQEAFQQAVDTWERLVSSPVPIRIDARVVPLPQGVLGAAGPTDYVVQDADGRYDPDDTTVPVALANAREGRDLDPAGADISAEISGDPSLFSYGATPVRGRYDFTTVVLHEIAHGLGFAGAMEVEEGQDGASRGYWDPGSRRPRPLAFDRHTVTVAGDGTATPLLSLPRGSTRLAEALTDGSARWDGAAGVAANGGVRPQLYGPATWEEGSSYSHLDEQAFPPGSPDSLMTPTLGLGEVVRDPGSVALGMLADLGWGSEPGSLRLSAPAAVPAGSTVIVTGAAPPGSTVQLWLKRRGSTSLAGGAAPGYVPAQSRSVGSSGRFDATFVADDDHRIYVQAGDRVSSGALTQVRPTLEGPGTRAGRRGASTVLTGRGQPGTRLTLRFTAASGAPVVRTVPVRADGTWSRSVVLTADLRVQARGANGLFSATEVLLQTR